MTSYVYRCSRCRKRKTLREPLWRFGVTPKCEGCGHDHFYLDKERMRRQPCRCDGGLLGATGPIPHRQGSPACIHNPMHPYHRAARAGADPDTLVDILIDIAWDGDGGRPMPEEAPF